MFNLQEECFDPELEHGEMKDKEADHMKMLFKSFFLPE